MAARGPDEPHTLIAVLDDATKRLLYAQLWPAESTVAVMTALRTVFTRDGLPVALYTDRAGWAFHTPQAGGRVDRTRLTQVGRPLAQLASSPSPSYCPQGRGRRAARLARLPQTSQEFWSAYNVTEHRRFRDREESLRYL